jgi:type IX secretion system PorP/SprF family membrane protein
MAVKFLYTQRILCVALACSAASLQVSRAQDVGLVQPYMAPLHLNPAYTGEEGLMRLGATCQYQPATFGNPYMLYAFYADYYSNQLNSGVGICAISDYQSAGAVMQTSVGASYAYSLQLAERTYIRFGIQGLLDMTSTQAANLVFPDMIDPYGNVAAAGSAPEQKNYFDMAIGMVLSHRMVYVGAALHNLMGAPNGTVLGQAVSTPRRLTLHAGCNLPLASRNRYSRGRYSKASSEGFTLSPNLIYGVQGTYQNVAVGGYLGYRGFAGGLFYKAAFTDGSAEASFYSIGASYSSDLFSVSYAFQLGLLSSVLPYVSTHEVSLLFKIKQRQKNAYLRNREKVWNVPCI